MPNATDIIDRFSGVIASLAIKVRCVLGATTNVPTLNGINNPYDGVFLADGDRVLLTAQTNPIENGAWNVCATGAWTRAQDWDGNRDVELGSTVFAGRSGIQSDVLYQVTAPSGIIQPGTTAVTISLLLDPDSAGGISGTTIDSTVRFDGVEYVENLNLLVEADGRVTHPNAIATRWLDSAAVPVDLIDFQDLSIAPPGVGSIVANFEGTNGDRTYTGDDGRIWTFGGDPALNEISTVEAAFGVSSYLVGEDNGAINDDDRVYTDINAEYLAGDFVMGTRDWYFKFNVFVTNSLTGGNDFCALASLTANTRGLRCSSNNNSLSVSYAAGGGSENNFAVFGALPVDSMWHEVVFERVSNGIYCYLDGVQSGGVFDCTGDNIGAFITGTAIMAVGASVNAGLWNVTPKPDTYIDAFEVEIGRSLNGGIAPGAPQPTPPNPDAETMIVGDSAHKVRIDANILSVNDAYDLPVADGAAGTVMTTDGFGTVRFIPLALGATVNPGVSAGNARDVLLWDGAAWSPAGATIRANLNSPPVGGRLQLLATATTNRANSILNFEYGVSGQGASHYWDGTTAGDNFSIYANFSFNPAELRIERNSVALLSFHADDSVRFSGTADLYIQQKGAAAADIATYGQIYVDSADDSLHYVNDTGVDQLLDPSISEINIQNGDYTLLISDKGRTIGKQLGGAGETITIPANASVAYPDGTMIGVDNDGGGDLTIAITTDTLVGTDGATGSRTLGNNQQAIIQKIAATRWRYMASDL